MEHTFVNKDAVATLKLGQARGIALLVPAQFGLTVGEYAPNAVKKAIVGVGHASRIRLTTWCGCICRGQDCRAGCGGCLGDCDLPCASSAKCGAVAGRGEKGSGMIGKISGRLDWRGADHVLIDVRGVGYIVHVSDRTMAGLPGLGEAVSLYTELLVREDLCSCSAFRPCWKRNGTSS